MAQAVRTGEVSSSELLEAHLTRLEQVAARWGGLAWPNPFAQEQAAAADLARVRQAGAALGPLHGVPVTVKDWIDVGGLPCAGGQPSLAQRIPRTDAAAVARLRSAGAVVLAKTAVGDDSKIYGRVTNPYGTGLSPAGSSSGEAVLVAACASPLGLGSDSGGSIRQPAHVCGIAGLKPTTGRVPLTGHFPPITALADPRTVIGPMSRRVEDLVVAMRVLAGPDASDPSAPAVPWPDPAAVDVSRLRVAVYTDHPGVEVDAATQAVVETVARALSQRGAGVRWCRPPGLADVLPITEQYWSRPESTDPDTWLPPEPEDGVAEADGRDVARHLFEWDRFRRRMYGFLYQWDAVLTPAAQYPALPHGVHAAIPWTLTFSLAGAPAGVVRAGTSPDHLPIGVQVAAAPWREDVVLAVLCLIEREFGGWQAP